MKSMTRFACTLLFAAALNAQSGTSVNPLAQFSQALEELTSTVSPAVVQVQVSAWVTQTWEGARGEVLSPGSVVGSGVIVDPSGYIITNEHVVHNARRVRVMLTPAVNSAGATLVPPGTRTVLEATVVGVHAPTDLALLKVEASGLPTLPIYEGEPVRPGQLVIAVGSPAGLDNTVTLGMVSAVGRQPHPDAPMVYIQTDAAISPGSSGGPLLDVEGAVVGINTFILDNSGTSQGLSFAVPAAVVKGVYDELRNHGSVRSSRIGINVQTITADLARGLGLGRDYGIVISDIAPGSPADQAGLKVRDVILEMDGAPVETVPWFAAAMHLHDSGAPLELIVLRRAKKLNFRLPVVAIETSAYGDSGLNPERDSIPRLGVVGKNIESAMHMGLRSSYGVYVAAWLAGAIPGESQIEPGDVIVSLNDAAIVSVSQLSESLKALTPDESAVLQVERNGGFFFVTLDVD